MAEKVVFKNPKTEVKAALERTYTERFEFLMKLIRIGAMLKNAKIIPSKK
jgi:hypothetical protein